jgi:redox-sensitive bicupin YhaK (pirin superfamily)
MMKTVIHRANSRGHADHGWLNTYHTFSFANYQHPERIHFGALRVLNDDRVAPGRGFGTHPHDNMEIISIPLEGDLEHKDSMGNVATIREGELQVMSAGTGIFHSEYNKNRDKEVKFLQIWVFPNKKNVEPRYDQISLSDIESKNEWFQVLSPDEKDQGVWIYQDAWFHLGHLDPGVSLEYSLKRETNGVYVFVLEGEVEVAGASLGGRDGMGIWDTSQIPFSSLSGSRLLLMEVPMNLNIN